MSIQKTLGIVVRRRDLGEADRLLTLLTARFGKVKAVAKGSRRTKSRFGGNLEPLAVAEFMLWRREGRDLAIVSGAELVEHFPCLSADLRAFASAQCAAEMLDRSLGEDEPHPRLFSSLVGFLRSLSGDTASAGLLNFTLSTLVELGYGVRGDRCARCLNALPAEAVPLWMDYPRGGLLCGECARTAGAGERIAARVSAVLRDASGRGRDLPEGPATEAVRALDRLLSYHQDRRVMLSPRLLTGLAVPS